MKIKLRYLFHKTVLSKGSSIKNHEELLEERVRTMTRESYFVVTIFCR